MARFAIGDIHGCSKTFKSLVEDKLQLKKEDHLYLLGDLVNKGPDSKGVLDYIFLLKKEQYQITAVRGNHDQMFLDAYYGKIADYWLTANGEAKTLRSFGVENIEKIPVQYFDFIRDMPFFLELDRFFLVHAGFNFTIDDPFQDFRAMMHSRSFIVKPHKIAGKSLVHGHVPTTMSDIEATIKSQSYNINIDSGCVYFLNEGLGFLTALNLDSFELISQENIDKPYPIDIKK